MCVFYSVSLKEKACTHCNNVYQPTHEKQSKIWSYSTGQYLLSKWHCKRGINCKQQGQCLTTKSLFFTHPCLSSWTFKRITKTHKRHLCVPPQVWERESNLTFTSIENPVSQQNKRLSQGIVTQVCIWQRWEESWGRAGLCVGCEWRLIGMLSAGRADQHVAAASVWLNLISLSSILQLERISEGAC